MIEERKSKITMTPYEMIALLALREQKLRNAFEQMRDASKQLIEWHRSRKAREKLFSRLDALDAQVAPKPVGRPRHGKDQ